MGAAPLRSLGDLSLDRGHLYAVHHAAEGQLFRHRGPDRGVVPGDRRHRAEDRTAGPVRPAGDRTLPRHGLERHDALRRRGGEAADTDAGFHARRWRAVYLRRDLPCLAAAALPERDLAWLRLAPRGLPWLSSAISTPTAREPSPRRSAGRPSNAMSERRRISFTSSRRPSISSA